MLDSNEFIFIGTCKNRRKDRFCQKLADKGYCNHKHANFMKKNCKQTCGICGKIIFGFMSVYYKVRVNPLSDNVNEIYV